MKTYKKLCLLLAIPALGASVASAQVLNMWNINFAGNDGSGTSQNQVGEQPVPDGLVLQAGSFGDNQWNNIVAPQRGWPSPGNLEMTDANGGNAINFTWEEFGGEGHHAFSTSGGITDELFVGYYGVGGFDTTLQMSGLDSDSIYDVYVYFTWGWNDDNLVDYSITTGSGDDLSATLDPAIATATHEDMVEGNNFVVFSGITPDAGAIHLNAMSDDGGFSGLQLVQVPEPSTYAAILGGIFLAFAVWRRRRSA